MNPFLSREWVHEHSEQIGNDVQSSRVAVHRLMRDNRRLAKFVEQNGAQFEGANAQVCHWLVGVVARLFEVAGGRMKAATWEHVNAASERVAARVPTLLPIDDGFVARARAADRRQPHILDEALYALFERDEKDKEMPVGPTEAVKIYLMMWVVTEVLDENWLPPKGFGGESVYAFTPVSPAADVAQP